MIDEKWAEEYVKQVPSFLKQHTYFTNDDVRYYMDSKGITTDEINVWGIMFNHHFAKSLYVVRTGRTERAKRKESRGRKLAVWLSLLCPLEGEDYSFNEQLIALSTKVKLKKIDILEALKQAVRMGMEIR